MHGRHAELTPAPAPAPSAHYHSAPAPGMASTNTKANTETSTKRTPLAPKTVPHRRARVAWRSFQSKHITRMPANSMAITTTHSTPFIYSLDTSKAAAAKLQTTREAHALDPTRPEGQQRLQETGLPKTRRHRPEAHRDEEQEAEDAESHPKHQHELDHGATMPTSSTDPEGSYQPHAATRKMPEPQPARVAAQQAPRDRKTHQLLPLHQHRPIYQHAEHQSGGGGPSNSEFTPTREDRSPIHHTPAASHSPSQQHSPTQEGQQRQQEPVQHEEPEEQRSLPHAQDPERPSLPPSITPYQPFHLTKPASHQHSPTTNLLDHSLLPT